MKSGVDSHALKKTKAMAMSATSKAQTTRSTTLVGKSVEALTRAFYVASAVLQEVFDESAYRRFLLRGNLEASAASYSAFWAEQEKSRARRPRCC